MLVLGETSEDVRNLQKKLNAIGITVAQSGVGSLGYESTYFGTLTVDAIMRFQCKYSIVCSGSPETTGYGNFGLKTRLMLNSL
jgi:peptidoglycan hydrolase-like protein with peptidoglycan-binding domain